MTRREAVSWMFVMFGVTFPDPALAVDLVALGQLLTPAYTVMSYDRLCQMEPKWLSAQPRGMKGLATNYAEYAKDETIHSLTYEQSLIVLRLAADTAKTEARRQLRENVLSEDKATEAVRFKAWCDGYVTDFIVAFINKYDGDHASFLDQLDAAKRGTEQ